MSTINFNSTSKELVIVFGGKIENDKIINLGKLSDNKIHCYFVSWEEETEGGMIPVGFIQNVTDVPSRSGASNTFIGVNALADALGTNDFSSNSIYRSRELVNKATAKALDEMKGAPIPGFTLIVTDSFEKSYDKQNEAVTSKGVTKTSNGKPFYTNVQLRAIGSAEHKVFKLDAVEKTTSEVVSEFNMMESPFK